MSVRVLNGRDSVHPFLIYSMIFNIRIYVLEQLLL